MPDSEHALLEQAFQHAEHCLTEANAIVEEGRLLSQTPSVVVKSE